MRIFLVVPIIFTCIAGFCQPMLTSFSPSAGPVGSQVVINGTGFSATPSNNYVFFGAVRANVVSASSNTLTVIVPAGSTYRPISVTTNNLTGYSAKPFNVTFSTAGSLSSVSFSTRFDSTVDLYPYGLTIADFDNDGKPDVATPSGRNSPSSSVSILRNTSLPSEAISFAPKQDIPSSLQLTSINSADIDGDGLQDIVTGSVGDQNISIFKNTSSANTISFAAKVDFPSANSPYEIAIGDLNNDGKPDLAVASYSANVVGVFINTSTPGDVSFSPRVDYMTALAPRSVAIADLDGDGKLEIITCNFYSNNISIFRNTSSGGNVLFEAKQDVIVGGNPFSVAAADLDGDNKPDLAVILNGSTTLSLLRNVSTGAISFSSAVNYKISTVLTDARKVAVANLDGDDKPDLVVTGPSTSINFYKNSSVSGALSFVNAGYVSSLSPYFASVSDLNLDSKPDLVVCNISSNSISVFKSRLGAPNITGFSPVSAGSGDLVTVTGSNFLGATAVLFGGVPATSFVVNSATSITAVVAAGASGEVSISTPEGNGVKAGFVFLSAPTVSIFSPTHAFTGNQVSITGTNFYSVTGVTFGGVPASSFIVNSPTSITATVAKGESGDVSVTNSYGTGSVPGFIYTGMSLVSFSPAKATAGSTVVITGSNFSNITSVRFGGSEAASFLVSSPSSISAVVAGGSDGDVAVTNLQETVTKNGFIFNFLQSPIINSISPTVAVPGDIVTITGQNFSPIMSENVVYFGASKASVLSASPTQLQAILPLGATCQRINILNKTTGLSALSPAPFLPTFPGIPSNLSTTSFNARTDIDFDVYTYPLDVAVFDLDLDGKPEIITTVSPNSNRLSILKNNCTPGNIAFAKPIQISGLTGNNFSVGDIDGDGRLDIVGSTNSYSVQVARNTGGLTFAPVKTFGTSGDTQLGDIADLDGDGRPEILATGYGVLRISILRNTSIPNFVSFAPKQDFSCFGTPKAVIAGDLNNDGKPDVVSANGSSNTITVFQNTSSVGNISLATGVQYEAGDGAVNIKIADFDGDGLQDIVVVNVYSRTLSMFRNITSGTNIQLASKIDYPINFNYGLAGLDVGDINGDGKIDIVVASGDMILYTNISQPGNISFVGPIVFGKGVPYSVSMADLDGDKRPELTSTINNWFRISIYKNSVLLPLTLVDFTATMQNNKTLLKWITANQVNTSAFIVEHSTDGQSFSALGTVNAINSSPNAYYSFTDNLNVSEKNFYRLRIVDKDGTFEYSKIIKVLGKIDRLMVSPNPASSFVRIKYPTSNYDATFQILDNNGKIVRGGVLKRGSNSYDISLRGIANGVYLIMYLDKRETYSKAFLIER